MLNLLFAVYICLIPLLMIWGLGISLHLNFVDKIKESWRDKKLEKRPIASRKVAANMKRRVEKEERLASFRQVEMNLSAIRKAEFYNIEGLKSRKLSFFPGCGLQVLTEECAKSNLRSERFAG